MSQFAAVDSAKPRIIESVSKPKNVELLARLESLLSRAERLETQIKDMEAPVCLDQYGS